MTEGRHARPEPSKADPSSLRPWQWPKFWWHDEKFWRETATRTLATLLSALIVYLVAVGAGYVRQPNVSRIAVAMVTPVILSSLFLYIFGRFGDAVESFIKRQQKLVRPLLGALAVVVANASVIGILVLSIRLIAKVFSGE